MPAMVMPSIRASGSPSISMRSENVPESPSSALQVTYFRPAASAQAGSRDRLHDGRRLHGQCPGEPLVAAVLDIIRYARGVDDAHALEGETLLTLEPGNRLRGPEGQVM